MKWAVFVSGRGSNLASLIESHPVSLVVSSKKKCPAVSRAKRSGVEVLFQGKDSSWSELTGELKKRKIDKIFLAGFMRIIPAEFISSWVGRIFNIHPSLLPKFKGLDAIDRAFNSNSPLGATVHEVDIEVDSGRILRQRNLGALNTNLAEASRRVHITEHRIVKEVVNCLG